MLIISFNNSVFLTSAAWRWLQQAISRRAVLSFSYVISMYMTLRLHDDAYSHCFSIIRIELYQLQLHVVSSLRIYIYMYTCIHICVWCVWNRIFQGNLWFIANWCLIDVIEVLRSFVFKFNSYTKSLSFHHNSCTMMMLSHKIIFLRGNFFKI